MIYKTQGAVGVGSSAVLGVWSILWWHWLLMVIIIIGMSPFHYRYVTLKLALFVIKLCKIAILVWSKLWFWPGRLGLALQILALDLQIANARLSLRYQFIKHFFFHKFQRRAKTPNDPKLSHADGQVAPQIRKSLYNSNRP